MLLFFLSIDLSGNFRISLKLMFLLNLLIFGSHLIFLSLLDLLHKLVSIVIFPLYLSFHHFLLHRNSPLFFIFDIFVDKMLFGSLSFGIKTNELLLL